MNGNNIVSLFLTIVLYVFIGLITLSFLLPIFPLFAVLIGAVLLISMVSSVINYFRFGISRAQTARARRKFDEYGNRKTTATIVEINESENPSPEQIDRRDNR